MYAICLKNANKKIADHFYAECPNNGAACWTQRRIHARFFDTQEEAVLRANDIMSAEIGDELGAGNNRTSLLLQGLLRDPVAKIATGVLVVQGFVVQETNQFEVKAEITEPFDFVNIPDGVTGRKIKARGSIISNLNNERIHEFINFDCVVSNQLRNRAAVILYCSNYFKTMMQQRMKEEPELKQALERAHPRFYADIVEVQHVFGEATNQATAAAVA